MKALSVRAPWWWWILHGGKDIENRDWYTNVRGRVLIHAGKWWNNKEIDLDIEAAEAMHRNAHNCQGLLVPQEGWESLKESCGCIVGSVEITACIDGQARPIFRPPWFTGRYAFCLKNPVALDEPIPFKGMLGFFEVPDSIVRV